MARLSEPERERHYGQPGHVDRRTVVTPWGPKATLHVRVADHFLETCSEADAALSKAGSPWRPRRVDSYNPRQIRGSDEWSMHAWALAVDIFSTPPNMPPPGGVWTPDDPPPIVFVQAFEQAGWTWGGRWRRKDEPHFEWANYPPTTAQRPSPTPQEDDDMTKAFFALPPKMKDDGSGPHPNRDDLIFVIGADSFHLNDEEDIKFWAAKYELTAPLPLTEERKDGLRIPSQVFSDLWSRRARP
jgi:hypothetical protein